MSYFLVMWYFKIERGLSIKKIKCVEEYPYRTHSTDGNIRFYFASEIYTCSF